MPELFGIDLRTLALFRVVLAGVTAFDLLRRLADVRAFYTDSGVMPRAWLAQTGETWRLSLHMANGETWFQATVIAAQAVLALMVLVGHRTRVAAVLTFVLLGSLHSRNPMVLIGGDELLMGLWFWALFLPIHARWSLDAALSTRPPPERSLHLSWASAALTLQVLYACFFSAALKTGADGWPDGTAAWYALLWLGPILALSPWLTRPLRFAVMVLLMAVQPGLLLCLDLGHLPWASFAALTVLLGGWWWDWAARRADHGRHLKIYYDQDCGFCLKSCVLLRHFLALQRTEILPAQGSTRANALMQAQSSWVVIDGEDVAHTKWAAWVALLRHSPLFGWSWRLAGLRLFEIPGNVVYDAVARHRGAIGTLTGWLLPERAVTFESGRGAQRLAAVMLVIVLSWNLASVQALPAAVAAMEAPLIRMLRLDQAWNLYPGRDDGWFVVPGKREDGVEVDVLRPGEPLSYARPEDLSATHAAPIRWRAYRNRIWDRDFAVHRQEYARWLCRDANLRAAKGQQVQSLKIVYMLERSQPPGVATSVEQRVVWRHDCVAPTPDEDAVD
jgi:predicted DCC family thiol-disulfide oxidoreductase YuxK